MTSFLAPAPSEKLKPGRAPTFSVVIPSFQAAATVGDAIGSALAQTMAPHEVIVVDDGSTDGTTVVLDTFTERIIRLRQENRGPSAARNAGIACATGDFVAFLDADDVFEPERLEALRELSVARPDLDILATDACFELEGKSVGKFFDRTPFATERQNLEIFERCFLACPAVRRESITMVGGFEETLRIAEDWECWIRLFHAGFIAGCVDEPLLRYRVGRSSLTSDRVAALRARVTVLDLAAELDLSSEERRALDFFRRRRRRRALVAEAQHALRHRSTDARGRNLRVMLTPGVAPGDRVRALAATLAPGAAARLLAFREGRRDESRIRR